MKEFIKQAIYITVCASIIGFSANIVNNNSISLLAKSPIKITEIPDSYDFGIFSIDLELAKQYFDKGLVFVDARDMESYNEGHIKNAIPSTPFEQLVNMLVEDGGYTNPMIVYCDDAECSMSEDLANKLQAEGFATIFVFSGGWHEWKEAQLSIKK